MSRALLILVSSEIRAKAKRWIDALPDGTRVEFKEARRTLDQSAKMWAMVTEVSEQCRHHGLKLSPADWKTLFVDALHRDLRVVPNLDGNGFVTLNNSSRDLSVKEMSDLIELIYAYGAKHGVKFGEKEAA